MNHISLDSQAETVKQLFLDLPVDAQGSVVELNGKAVACVVPVGTSAHENGSWTEAKNGRRYGLIDKEIDGTLSPAEAAELARLQGEMLRYRRKIAPLPLSEARRLHQELLQQAGKPHKH